MESFLGLVLSLVSHGEWELPPAPPACGPLPVKGEGSWAEDQQISLLLPLLQNAIHLKISFNLEPCRVWKALQVHLGWWIGNWVYLDVGAVFASPHLYQSVFVFPSCKSLRAWRGFYQILRGASCFPFHKHVTNATWNPLALLLI